VPAIRPSLIGFWMTRPDERELRELLVKLRTEHRDLDSEIVALEASGQGDQLQIKRLKKRKLQLKDHITAVEDKLTPDIIA
jgi:hypothetical protein